MNCDDTHPPFTAKGQVCLNIRSPSIFSCVMADMLSNVAYDAASKMYFALESSCALKYTRAVKP